MEKESAIYTEHILDIFSEVIHETITMDPLHDAGGMVTPPLAQCLQFIFRHGMCSITDIARGLSITDSAASQLTDRLVKKGLVIRSASPQDRRLAQIRLTGEGHDILNKIRHRRIVNMSKILDRMQPESRRALIAGLERFITAAIEDSKTAQAACIHCGKDHIAECIINKLHQATTSAPIDNT